MSVDLGCCPSLLVSSHDSIYGKYFHPSQRKLVAFELRKTPPDQAGEGSGVDPVLGEENASYMGLLKVAVPAPTTVNVAAAALPAGPA